MLKRSKHLHAKGNLTLSVDRSRTDTKTVYCCSSDNTFGLWTCTSSGDLECDVQNTANNCHGALAVYGADVYISETSQDVITGIDQQCVIKYGLSAFLPSHPILTFNLEVTALDCNGTHLIAGSNDFIVKCIRLEEDADGNTNVDRYDLDGIVLSILISPDGDYFSVSTSDGYVQIKPTIKSATTRKSLAKFKVYNEMSRLSSEIPRIQCAWHEDGRLFMPGKGCIIPVDCATWEKQRMLAHSEIENEHFSVITLSSQSGNCFFLAASSLEGTIAIWNFTQKAFHLINIRTKIQNDIGTITSIIFNPQDDAILLIGYSEGYICSMNDVKQPNERYSQFTQSHDVAAIDNRPFSADEIVQLDQDNNDMDLESDLGLIKSQFGYGSNNAQINSQINASSLHYNPSLPHSTEPCTTVKGMRVPKAFSNGSTSAAEGGRYLAWNSFGIIKSYNNDEDTTIEINFHDSTIHHEIIMDNTLSAFVFGDINSQLIALASAKNSNKESELYVYHVTSWDHESRKWTQVMNNEEIIEGLCVGREFIAISTNLRYLRIFTPSGTQRYVISLAGHLLTICARENKLATAYSLGGVIVETEDDYEHQIFADQYDVDPLSGECSPTLEWTIPLALSPYSKLNWMQFSTSGNLVTMDAECTVRIYLHQKGSWIPVLIGAQLLKEPGTDSIWPIALSEIPHAQFRYIHCRNSKYPPVNKSTSPSTTVQLAMPTINPSSERSKLEAELMVNELQQIIGRQASLLGPDQAKEMTQLTQNYVANLLKLFSISCQMNRESRAAEVAHRATNSKFIQGLCNYAAKVQRPNLSEKVAAIGRERLRAIENGQQKSRNNARQTQRPFMVTNPANQMMDLSAKVPVESPIAPAKILMPKRKIPQISSLTSAINSRDKNFQKELANQLGEKENDKIDDDGVSSIGVDSELDISISSSAFLSTSVDLDSPMINNPFKKLKRTTTTLSTTTDATTTSGNKTRRGFSEMQREDDDTVPDFFDSLMASNGRKK